MKVWDILAYTFVSFINAKSFHSTTRLVQVGAKCSSRCGDPEPRRSSSPHNALQAQLLEQHWQVFLLDLNYAMIKRVNLDPCLCLLSHFLKRKPKPIPAITTFLHLRMQLLIFSFVIIRRIVTLCLAFFFFFFFFLLILLPIQLPNRPLLLPRFPSQRLF